MRAIVESLRRLYKSGKITEEKVAELLAEGKITQEEYDHIMGA